MSEKASKKQNVLGGAIVLVVIIPTGATTLICVSVSFVSSNTVFIFVITFLFVYVIFI